MKWHHFVRSKMADVHNSATGNTQDTERYCKDKRD